MKNMNKLLGFTLAETLVVIGLIGIVSALTLPNLNSKTGDKEQVVRVQKQQQVLTEAYGRARVKYGRSLTAWLTLDENNTDRSARVANRLKEFMSVKKDCGTSANSGCFASSNVSYLSGGTTTSYDASNTTSKFIANDGTSFAVSCQYSKGVLVGWSSSLVGGSSSYTLPGCYITVDVDGPNKGPNKVGKDLFRFTITGKSPQIFTSPLTLTVNSNYCRTGDVLACTTYVLENGTTDYPEGVINLPKWDNVCSKGVCEILK